MLEYSVRYRYIFSGDNPLLRLLNSFCRLFQLQVLHLKCSKLFIFSIYVWIFFILFHWHVCLCMGAIFFKIIEVLNSCEYNLVQVVYHRVHFLLLLQFNKASPGWWMAFLYSELTFRDSGSFSFFDFTIPQSLTVIYIKSGERYKECEETTCLLFKGLIWEVTHSTYACIYW